MPAELPRGIRFIVIKAFGSIAAPYGVLLIYAWLASNDAGGITAHEAMGFLVAVVLMTLPVMLLARLAIRAGMKADGWAEWGLRLVIWMTVGIHLGLATLEDGLGVNTSCFRELYEGNPPVLRAILEGVCLGGLVGLASNTGALIGAKCDAWKSGRTSAPPVSPKG